MSRLRVFLALSAATLVWLAPGALAQAQQKPEESVAEAARRARAEKKSAPQATRVWTNDTISGAGPVNVVGASGESAGASSSGDGAAAPTASKEEEEERAKAEAAVKEEKARLAQLKSDLSLLQRDYDLSRRQFFSNPDYANDSAGQRRLDEQQAAIDGKKSEIQQSEQKVAELEAALKEINQRLGPPAKEPLTPEEQQAQWGDRIRSLEADLARVEKELQSLRGQVPSSPAPSSDGGSNYTRDRIAQLEREREEIRRKLSDVRDEARRSGAPPAWTRP